ncbi:hypothetical protein MNBD_DELTA01-254 [hydrothermal vent metagenome]|uniref:DUF4115 domain-containing protein n=1 Tax=hydrothermal vent metagenome TaxID=652676 RepID=A0A3B0R0V1_9ZZZZ
MTVEDISEAMKMSVKLVTALEHDDHERLPHPTYVKGFVRAYACYLGIDEDDAVLRYEAYQSDRRIEAEKVKKLTADVVKDEYTPPSRMASPWRSRGLDIGRLFGSGRRGGGRGSNRTVAIFVGLGVLIVILYFVFAGGDAGETPKLVKAPVEKINKTYKADLSTGKAIVPGKQKAKVKAAKSKDKAALPRKAAAAPLVKESAKKPAAPVAPAASVTEVKKELLLEVVAKDTTWMGIEIDGKEQREALLQPGETARWRAAKVFF